MLLDLALFFLAFALLWIGSGLVVDSVGKFAKSFKLKTFWVSFFLLGILTSLPEMALAFESVVNNKPQMFVGNLVGGITVLLLLLMPILAIASGKIVLDHDINSRNVFIILSVLLLPSFFLLDQVFHLYEGVILIIVYVLIFSLMRSHKSFVHRVIDNITNGHVSLSKQFVKILLGIVLIVFASNIVIKESIRIVSQLQISDFMFGLIFLSIGTNLPEISLAVKAALSGKSNVAFGEYLGSAVANSAILGIFSFVNGGAIYIDQSFIVNFAITLVGLGVFYYFTRTKNTLTRAESAVLIVLYVIYFLSEFNIRL